jgi:hypothetical protein
MTDRLARLSAALLFAIPMAAAPLAAQGVEYATGTTKYRLTGTSTGTQTMPTGSASFEVGVMQQITVNIAKTAKDTVKATMTLDSISLKSQGPVPDLSALRGALFTATLSPTGKLYSAKGPDDLNPALGQVVNGITKILPTYRPNIAKGVTWSDTTSGKVNQQGLAVDQTIISSYNVAGDTVVGGQKAWKVDRVTSIKAGGAGTMGGTPVTMASEGSSTGSFFLTPSGVYLGSVSVDLLSVKITIVGQNAEVSIKQNATTNVEAIK